MPKTKLLSVVALLLTLTLFGCDAALTSAVQQALTGTTTALIDGAFTDWLNRHNSSDTSDTDTTDSTDSTSTTTSGNSSSNAVSVSGNTINLPTSIMPSTSK